MPWSFQEHLENLTRHIELVRENCALLGRRLLAAGKVDENFVRDLVALGHVHDASKFRGIEWDYLHTGPDTPEDLARLATEQHVRTNPHHPECWNGFDMMPR